MQVLFICRKSDYHFGSPYNQKATGLKQSAGYCRDVLNFNGIPAEMVIVNDNNDIDREVTKYKPAWVIIEALWVVPEKFEVLKRLHPDVRWVIRLHSELPFIAFEGPAMDWVNRCAAQSRVHVSANSIRMVGNLRTAIANEPKEGVLYLPNCFVFSDKPIPPRRRNTSPFLDIACLGAIRPMKNQLLQAVAALQFAREEDKFLMFHMNSDRIEGAGGPIKKNIEQLFSHHGARAELQFHPWLGHDDLIGLLPRMDLGMQVSFTETFNHMTAEMVALNIPVVVSPEVRWVSPEFMADPTSVEDVVEKMHRAFHYGHGGNRAQLNLLGLEEAARRSADIWLRAFS